MTSTTTAPVEIQTSSGGTNAFQPDAASAETPIISVRGLTKRYGKLCALRDVDLQVPGGCVFALLGQNGAGKTTLINILTGLQRPTSGSAQVLGHDCVSHSRDIRTAVGYVSDMPAMYSWMTPDQLGWFTSAFYPEGFTRRYRALLAHYQVPFKTRFRKLSRGQRAKVSLALAAAHSPPLLIMDEPTSGLDPLVRRQFLESMVDVAAAGRTVLLSSHQINEVQRVADRVAILHRGEIRVCATLADLRDSTHEFTCTVDDPLVALARLDAPADGGLAPIQVLHQHQDGRQHRFTLRGQRDDLQRRLLAMDNVTSVQHRQPSLEDVFVAVTSDSTQEMGGQA